MIRKTTAFFLVFVGLFLHAEPQKTFAFLDNIAKLEYHMNKFSASYILSYMFPANMLFKGVSSDSFDRYNGVSKQISIELNNIGEYKILGSFSKAKIFLVELLDARPTASNIEKLLSTIRDIETKADKIVNDNYSELITNKRHSYVLTKMRWYLWSTMREYLALEVKGSREKRDDSALKKRINDFEKAFELFKKNWTRTDPERILHISKTWETLKSQLKKPAIPMVINVGMKNIDYWTQATPGTNE